MAHQNDDPIVLIYQYQKSLEKYTHNMDINKLLYYMRKLNKMPITVKHLTDTGIGRTVNALRKLDNEAGEVAKVLVAKWKDMVMKEDNAPASDSEQEEGEEEEEEEEEDGDDEDEEKETSDTELEDSSHQESDKKAKESNRSRHREKETEYDRKDKHSSKHDKSHDKSVSKKIKEKRRAESSDEQSGDVKHRKSNKHIDSDGDSDGRHKKCSSKESSNRNQIESDTDSESDHKNKTNYKTDKHDSHTHKSKHEKIGKHKTHSTKRKHDTEESESDGNVKKQKVVEKDEQKKKDKYLSKKHEKKSHEKHKTDHTSKNTDGKKKHSETSKSKDHSSHRKSSKDKTKKHDTKTSIEQPNTSEKIKSHHSSNHKKKVRSTELENGIDCGSGASFAEALGMLIPSSSKNSTKKKSTSSTKSVLKEDSLPNSLKSVKIPPLLQENKFEPIELNISSLLPAITPNYRPLGIPINNEPVLRTNKVLSDEALAKVMSSKNQRTKVYSGNKSIWNKVPSLFEMCIRILQDNIDALEYTGGVPYIILKPVLEKATADQLFMLEHHNPYLIEETDELWYLHCQKEFKTKQREELESWREMYMRCLDEREARLKALTANIKMSQDKSTPLRQTKLAYVDNYVKPPRQIAKKQAKNGIISDKTPSITPTARLNAIAASASIGQVHVPNPGARAAEQRSSSSSSSSIKPKKAPLMQKTLALIKSRFRR